MVSWVSSEGWKEELLNLSSGLVEKDPLGFFDKACIVFTPLLWGNHYFRTNFHTVCLPAMCRVMFVFLYHFYPETLQPFINCDPLTFPSCKFLCRQNMTFNIG